MQWKTVFPFKQKMFKTPIAIFFFLEGAWKTVFPFKFKMGGGGRGAGGGVWCASLVRS